MSLRKSKITCVFDFFLYLLIIGSASLITYILWKRIHWLLAIILAFPIYRVIGYFIIFLTAPLYNWLTPENKAWSIFCNTMDDVDSNTSSIIMEAIERWNDGGDCSDLQECCKRVRDGKSTSLNTDMSKVTVEAGTRKD
jgi:hypothetical protein